MDRRRNLAMTLLMVIGVMSVSVGQVDKKIEPYGANPKCAQ